MEETSPREPHPSSLLNPACEVPDLFSPSRIPRAPGWIDQLIGSEANPQTLEAQGFELEIRQAGELTLVSVVVPKAEELKPDDFKDSVRTAYGVLLDQLHDAGLPVRLWNYIPGILSPFADLPHRYMAFNEARYDAFTSWYETHESFPATLATASGTGNPEPDLVLYGLSTQTAGIPVENPRQIPSYRYSFRYGPRPPCFARATHLAPGETHQALLLVGGTASITGEDSLHPGDLAGQTHETAINLEALIRNADSVYEGDLSNRQLAYGNGHLEQALSRFRHLRVYYPNPNHAAEVADLVHDYFGESCTVELMRTDLCRPELLIEIEGIAVQG